MRRSGRGTAWGGPDQARGSVFRGGQDEDSDVDICYDLVEGGSLKIEDGVMFGAFRSVQLLQHDLGAALGLPVDVCSRPGSQGTRAHRLLYDEVERDRRLIYECEAV